MTGIRFEKGGKGKKLTSLITGKLPNGPPILKKGNLESLLRTREERGPPDATRGKGKKVVDLRGDGRLLSESKLHPPRGTELCPRNPKRRGGGEGAGFFPLRGS